MDSVRFLANGDAALVVEFGDQVELSLSERVLALADGIAEACVAGVIETIPTFRSLMISFDPARISFGALVEQVTSMLVGSRRRARSGRIWRLPVCYDREVAPDLDEVSSRVGLTPTAFIDRHCDLVHHVYMLGFLPGQPYLGDLPPELALPRRQTPRAKITAGSVGVAGGMTCVFPKETPCGLHIVGRTPAVLWDARRKDEALLAPGDSVTFEPIALGEFLRMTDLAARDEFSLLPASAAHAAGTAA